MIVKTANVHKVNANVETTANVGKNNVKEVWDARATNRAKPRIILTSMENNKDKISRSRDIWLMMTPKRKC